MDMHVYGNFSYWIVGALYHTPYMRENALLSNTHHLALNAIGSNPRQMLNVAKQMPFSSLG